MDVHVIPPQETAHQAFEELITKLSTDSMGFLFTSLKEGHH